MSINSGIRRIWLEGVDRLGSSAIVQAGCAASQTVMPAEDSSNVVAPMIFRAKF
jgi:hypothetical protein